MSSERRKQRRALEREQQRTGICGVQHRTMPGVTCELAADDHVQHGASWYGLHARGAGRVIEAHEATVRWTGDELTPGEARTQERKRQQRDAQAARDRAHMEQRLLMAERAELDRRRRQLEYETLVEENRKKAAVDRALLALKRMSAAASPDPALAQPLERKALVEALCLQAEIGCNTEQAEVAVERAVTKGFLRVVAGEPEMLVAVSPVVSAPRPRVRAVGTLGFSLLLVTMASLPVGAPVVTPRKSEVP